MKRREFAIALGVGPLLGRPAWAAVEAVEGKNYIRLSSTVVRVAISTATHIRPRLLDTNTRFIANIMTW